MYKEHNELIKSRVSQTSDINTIKHQEALLNDKNLAGAACLTKSGPSLRQTNKRPGLDTEC